MEKVSVNHYKLRIKNLDIKDIEVNKFSSFDFFYLGKINLDTIRKYVDDETFFIFEKYHRVKISSALDVGKKEIIYTIKVSEDLLALEIMDAILDLYRKNGIIIENDSVIIEKHSTFKEKISFL